jgi:O-antigen ligase
VGPAPAPWSAESDEKDEGLTAPYLGECIRRIALGLTAALLTARAYSTSELDLEKGAGAGLSWILALLLAAGLALTASLIGGRFRWRWSWTDAAVVALMFLAAISATHALDRRPAINVAWEWVALGVAYLLLRNLPRTRDESSTLTGAMVATAVAVSVYGLYQATVELPQMQTAFRLNPQPFLRELNIVPGSREHMLLAQRLLGSNEIWSTFALANSLAVFLVGPLVLAVAVGFHNLVHRDGAGSRGTALAMAAPLVLVLLICLILTKSRSAYLGLLAVVGLLAWRARKRVPVRVLMAAGLAGLGVIAILVTAGLATGRLDREVLTQSPMSLRYRWEYWQGTWGVLTHGAPGLRTALGAPTFWSGVGPANFRAAYLRYKLPQASEEILDPHDLFLEVWATGGFWALLALIAALAFGLWNLLGPPMPMRSGARARADAGRPPPGRERAGRPTATPGGAPPTRGDQDADAPPSRPIWLVAAAGAGWVMVVLLGQLNPFKGDLFSRWLILGAGWVAAVWLGAPLWRRLSIPAWALGAAVLAVLINLLAAGGIGIPTVALGLWSLVALGLNLRDDRGCSKLREYPSRVPPFALAAFWAAVLGVFLGTIVPFWQSEAAIAEAEEAINHLPPDFDRAENAYRRAIAADRYNVRPWLGYANLVEHAWEWRGAKVEDQRWKQIPILLQEAVSLPRNPSNWALHVRRADRIRELLRRIGPQLSPLEAIRLGGEIVKETRIATLLYPTNAELHARLAVASAEIQMYGDAVKEAEEALRLDRLLTPHPDKRLAEPLRSRLEAQLPEWKEKKPLDVKLDPAP